jgi:tripartite-type tricarboxylate transporter receptor subunit TctC
VTKWKRTAAAAMTAVLLLWPAPAPAQGDYPKQPVRIIVANTPGTAGDNLVRIVAAKLGEVMGQQFYITNHPGAGGTIGAEMAARAAPDGYTLLQTSTPLQVIAPHLRKNLKYDSFKDFTPLVVFAKTENVLVAHPALPFKTVKDVIDHAKANPGKLKMANAGIGFQSHLANVMFANAANINVLHVAYKGAASMQGVLTGESDLTIGPLPAIIGLVRSGGVRPIATTGTERTVQLPDVPTIAESGLPGYAASGWNGLLLPAGTPKEIVDKLTAGLTKVLNDPDVKDHLQRAGGDPWLLTGDEMAQLVRREYQLYGELIRKENITLN